MCSCRTVMARQLRSPPQTKRRFWGGWGAKLFEDIFKSFHPIDIIQKVFETFAYFWSSDIFWRPREYSTVPEYSTRIIFWAQNRSFLSQNRKIYRILLVKEPFLGLKIASKLLLNVPEDILSIRDCI